MKSHLKPILFIAAITSMISIAATLPPQQQEQPYKAKNLKVLPKDISHDDLEKVMHGFNDALGVKCNHCHASDKNNPKKLNFASDEKEYKNAARYMMKMTAKINAKYFKEHEGDDDMPAIQCMTCHRGHEKPEFQMPEHRQEH
ncbi:MAG: c-type cytochrome [Sphingobacteriales bacterium]|nr:c-type cytochrome [Sphingobacteriales bacterium]